MTWIVNTGVRCDSVISTIHTNLTANGWTDYDPGQAVYSSVNDQGVTQYCQITQSGSYLYLQFQAWQSWNAGTHAGSNGSGTAQNRMYFASVAQAAATLVDLYMSVTANRFIILMNSVVNFRQWAYFGGLDAMAGVSDPFCAFLMTSWASGTSTINGAILQPAGGGTYWSPVVAHSIGSYNTIGAASPASGQLQGNDFTQFWIFPILAVDGTVGFLRGNLDGLYFCPTNTGMPGHMYVLSIGGTDHLVFIPYHTGTGAVNFTGTAGHGLAVVEA